MFKTNLLRQSFTLRRTWVRLYPPYKQIRSRAIDLCKVNKELPPIITDNVFCATPENHLISVIIMSWGTFCNPMALTVFHI